jgi:hypothetical protein
MLQTSKKKNQWARKNQCTRKSQSARDDIREGVWAKKGKIA